MRSVITSQIEDVGPAAGGGVVYQLSNGLSWASPEGSDHGFGGESSRVTLYHEGGVFYLGIEGSDGRIEVTLVACRRKVWDEPVWRGMQLALL